MPSIQSDDDIDSIAFCQAVAIKMRELGIQSMAIQIDKSGSGATFRIDLDKPHNKQ